MIYAKLNSPSTYIPLLNHPVWTEVINLLKTLNENTPLGITFLKGNRMYMNVHAYDTENDENCRYEGHRDMIDVQYIIAGGEMIDWVLKSELKPDGPFLVERDFQYYLAPEFPSKTRIHLKSGYFGVFFPEDGHRPKINDGVEKGVLKAVVKIDKSLVS